MRVGVVGFDGSSHILLDPTTDTAAVKRTIDRLQLGEGTAIGEAVFSSLEAINAPDPANTGDATTTTTPPTTSVKPTDGKLAGAVVLLSDGETTAGPPERRGRAGRGGCGRGREHDRLRHRLAASSPGPTARRSPCRSTGTR